MVSQKHGLKVSRRSWVSFQSVRDSDFSLSHVRNMSIITCFSFYCVHFLDQASSLTSLPILHVV